MGQTFISNNNLYNRRKQADASTGLLAAARGSDPHGARQLIKLGGDPVYREGVLTDSDNIILDVFNLSIVNPQELEAHINAIVGLITNSRPADVLLLGTPYGLKPLRRN